MVAESRGKGKELIPRLTGANMPTNTQNLREKQGVRRNTPRRRLPESRSPRERVARTRNLRACALPDAERLCAICFADPLSREDVRLMMEEIGKLYERLATTESHIEARLQQRFEH